MTKPFETEDFSDIKTPPVDKLIKLQDRRKQNWQEMQSATSEELKMLWEVAKEIDRRIVSL